MFREVQKNVAIYLCYVFIKSISMAENFSLHSIKVKKLLKSDTSFS